MKEKIKELLNEDSYEKKEFALSILFLKYKMVCESKESIEIIDFKSYFCIDDCYDEEIKKLEEHYSIEINHENPFTHEVVQLLRSDYLIDISASQNNMGNLKIAIPSGINYLREKYNSKKENDEELNNIIVYNIVKNINVHIGDTIINITKGMSKEEKSEFIELLHEYSKEKNKKSFLKKLTEFSGKVGEEIFVEVIANLLNPNNLSTILGNIKF